MFDKHNIVGLILPTIEPYTMRKYFLSSLENLKEIAPIANVCINFQNPYTQEDVDEIVSKIESYGFKVYWQLREKYEVPKKGYVQFNKIRNDAVKLNPNSLIYVLTDDDFSYQGPSPKSPSAGVQYLRTIFYMLNHYEKCGCVLTGGSMYRYNPINTIGPTKDFNNEWFITGKSLFLRSMRDYGYELFPEDSLELYGAKEECLLCASRINEGLFPAKFGNARIKHDENRNHDENIQPGYEEFGWLEDEIIENNVNKYIRDHYHTNMRGVYCYDVCLPEVYKKKSGIDHKDERDFFLYDFEKDFKYSDQEFIRKIIFMAEDLYDCGRRCI